MWLLGLIYNLINNELSPELCSPLHCFFVTRPDVFDFVFVHGCHMVGRLFSLLLSLFCCYWGMPVVR